LRRNSVHLVTFNELDPISQASLDEAEKARGNSYSAVFKRISVGVAYHVVVRGETTFVPGSNLEHPMPQLCSCAELIGIGAMHSRALIDSAVGITVVAQRRIQPRDRLILPCDMCRARLVQLAEWSGVGDGFRIIAANPNYKKGGKILLVNLGTLLRDERLRYSPDGVDPKTLLPDEGSSSITKEA
jgi:cytidine deaminase